MRLRYSLVVAAALAVGALSGWGIGSAPKTCEYNCPPKGYPCPEPPDCRIHHFHWLPAIVIGPFVTVLIASVAIAVMRRGDDS